jgi:imidazoleglycerol-phosphate dehydratase
MPTRKAGSRSGKVRRKTKEVDVEVRLVVDGKGNASADTGIPFFDHMLEQLGKHAGFDLTVKALGDLKVDAHHTVEDTGLAIGDALRKSLGARGGIARFGDALVPLDESLLQVALDLSSRPFVVHEVDAKTKMIGTFDTRLAEEFVRAFAQAAGATIHVRMLAGKNPHHIVEAEFKALAQALRKACARSGRRGVPSTKGKL